MAAKPLTTEEKNYLRSVYLTSIIGTNAVRTHFDFLHPPANLVTHLANDKSELEWLKEDGFISSKEWEKLFPRSGATCTSAEFDITILICLLREMTPKVPAPRHTGFDQLPDRADKSTGACLAIIKWYRNFLAHPHQVKLKTLSGDTFKVLFEKVGMLAIKVLGNNQYCSEVEKARQLNIDNDFAEILEKFVTHEKQLEDFNASVEQNRKQINHLQTLCKENRDKSDEHENEIRTLETSLSEFDKDISYIKSKLKLDIEAIEKKVIDLSKQLAEFKTQTNATLALHGKNITELSEQQQDYHSQTEELTKNMKEQSKQINEGKEERHELKETQSKHATKFQTMGQKQDEQTKEWKEWKEKQQDMKDEARRNLIDEARRNLIDQTKAMIQNEANVYVITRAVAKCLEVLNQNKVLVLAADGGRGKTALSLYLAKLFLEDNYGNYKPLLFVEKDIVLKRSMIDFKENYFIIIDDLFGRSNVRFDDETHKNILDILNINMKGEQCKCKLILTVRKTPGSLFDLFDKHEIFKQATIISLDDKNFALTRDEKKNILINLLKQFSVSICNFRDRIWLADTCDEPCKEMPGNTLKLCNKVVEDILNFDTYNGFPQACRLFSSNPSFTKMGVKYFQNPNQALVEEIESLHTDAIAKNIIERYQFCILVYLAVKDEIDLYNVDKIFFGHLLDKFGDSNFTPNVLKRSMKGISDKYLVGDFTRQPCRLQHATIREAILISYGKDYPDEILSHCSFDFFSEYFRPRDFEGIYICIEDKMIINYLMLKVPYVDINLVKQYIEKVSMNLCTETSNQVLSFFKSSTTLLDDDKYLGILNSLMGQRVPNQFEPYIGHILNELLKMEDVDIISKFIRPNGCLKQEKNAVKVNNEIFARRLLDVLVGISCGSTFSPNDTKQNTIGRYLYKVELEFDGKSFVEKFLSMVDEHIRKINPISLEYMLDGFTKRGQRKEVVSQYQLFCDKYLFSYGSINVVLKLCCPSSYEGSSNSFVKVNNSLLADKLLSTLIVQGDGSDSDDHDYDDNESDFCHLLVEEVGENVNKFGIVEEVGEYVYKFGIEENDENFINAIADQLSFHINLRDNEFQIGEYLDDDLFEHFLYKGLDCKKNMETIEQFPELYVFIEQFIQHVGLKLL